MSSDQQSNSDNSSANNGIGNLPHLPTFSVVRPSRNSPRSSPRIYRHRKMSFPAAVSSSSHSNVSNYSGQSLNSYAAGNLDIPLDLANRRIRRFSNVSDAVSRKLSTTIGWRTVSVQDIVSQAKSLCGQYIRCRLKRSGLFNRKLGLQRLRSMANIPGGAMVCDIFVQLQAIGLEMERDCTPNFTKESVVR